MIHLRIVPRLRKHGCLPPVPHTPSSRDASLSRGTASYVPISGDCQVGAVQYAILKVVKIYLCVCVCVCVCAICDVMWKPGILTFAFSWISVYICTQPDSTADRKVGSPSSCSSSWDVRSFIPRPFTNSLLQDSVRQYIMVTLIEIQFDKQFYFGRLCTGVLISP